MARKKDKDNDEIEQSPGERIQELARHAGIEPSAFVAALKGDNGAQELDKAILGLVGEDYEPAAMALIIRLMHVADFKPEKIKNAVMQFSELEASLSKLKGLPSPKDIAQIFSSAGNVTELTDKYFGLGTLGLANIARKVIAAKDDNNKLTTEIGPEIVRAILHKIAGDTKIAARWTKYLDHPDKNLAWSITLAPATVQKLAGHLAAVAGDKELITFLGDSFQLGDAESDKTSEAVAKRMRIEILENPAFLSRLLNHVANLIETAGQDAGVADALSRSTGISREPIVQLIPLLASVCKDPEMATALIEIRKELTAPANDNEARADEPQNEVKDDKVILAIASILTRHPEKVRVLATSLLANPGDIERMAVFLNKDGRTQEFVKTKRDVSDLLSFLKCCPQDPEQFVKDLTGCIEYARRPLEVDDTHPSTNAAQAKEPEIKDSTQQEAPVLEAPVSADRTAFVGKPSVNLGAAAVFVIGAVASFFSQFSRKPKPVETASDGTTKSPEKPSFWSWQNMLGIALTGGAIFAGYRAATLPDSEGLSWVSRVFKSKQAGLEIAPG